MESLSQQALEKLTKAKLVQLCTEQQLPSTGVKAVLIERLLGLTPPPTAEAAVSSTPPEVKAGCEWIFSMDIGKNNFSFCIEEVCVEPLRKLNTVRKFVAGTTDLTDAYRRLLDTVFQNGRIILIDNVSLTHGCRAKGFDYRILRNLTGVLDQYSAFWGRCTRGIIEEQMAFGRKVNLMAIKIAQHAYSYFDIRLPAIQVTCFPSYHKTKVLGAPKFLTKPQRKRWSIEQAQLILEHRGDSATLAAIKERTKQDDQSDVITQLQAYKYLHYVEGEF